MILTVQCAHIFIKPSLRWKCPKMKMYLMVPVHWTSGLSNAYHWNIRHFPEVMGFTRSCSSCGERGWDCTSLAWGKDSGSVYREGLCGACANRETSQISQINHRKPAFTTSACEARGCHALRHQQAEQSPGFLLLSCCLGTLEFLWSTLKTSFSSQELCCVRTGSGRMEFVLPTLEQFKF